jgi:hypothetical protein
LVIGNDEQVAEIDRVAQSALDEDVLIAHQRDAHDGRFL